MSIDSKIAWKEGVFLQPHHFQQMEQGINRRINHLYGASLDENYGFLNINIEYNIDIETIKVIELDGVTPAGTPFSLKTPSSVPQSRTSQGHFDGDKKSLIVYLALPKIEYGSRNVTDNREKEHSFRYVSSTEEVIDEYYGVEKQNIEFGELNFQLLFDDEKRDGFELLPAIRLIKDSEKGIILDKSFVPPLLNVFASNRLQSSVNKFSESIISKSIALSANRLIDNEGYAGYDSGREGSIMLLHTLNGAIPVIVSMLKSKRCKPVELFREILSLAGKLCTFSSEVTVADLPIYNHGNISECFDELIDKINIILSSGVRENCITISMGEVGPAKFGANIENSKLFINSNFYLGIYADIPENELVVSILPMIKLSSREDLESIITSSLPGIPIFRTFDVPSEIPQKPGFVYFKIDTDDPKWQSVKRTSVFQVYLPGEMKDLKIELFALRKEGGL